MCLTPCNPMDHRLPGSSVHKILQAIIWSGWQCPPPEDLPDPGTEPVSHISCLASGLLPTSTTREDLKNGIQFSSVAQSCPTICNPMDCSPPGLPVHHQLQELTQTHVHRVSDAIQPSHTLSSPSPPAFNLSHHQCLFQWVNYSHYVDKVLEFQHQSFQWIFRTDFL